MDPETAERSEAQATGPKQEIKREAFELVKMVLLFLVLFWVIKTFVIEGYEVLGPSMLPTLDDRERVLVLKLPHHLSTIPFLSGLNAIDQHDIVVFKSEDETKKPLIKRVIAEGPKLSRGKTVGAAQRDGLRSSGDTVKVKFDRGTVYVNNRRYAEDYLVPEEGSGHSNDVQEVELHSGEYYVLGDHRSVSKDSRTFGPITNEQIVGRAVFRFWPPSKIGLL